MSVLCIASTAKAQVYTLPFTRAGNLILVTGKIGNQTGNFILDTGAPYLVLNETYFEGELVNNSIGAGLGENTAIAHLTIEELSLSGILTWNNLNADVVSLKAVEDAKKVKILGLLGIQLLLEYELTINYAQGQLYLASLDRKGERIRSDGMPKKTEPIFTEKIMVYNNHIFTNIKVGRKKLRTCIDTGAESCVLHNDLNDQVWEHVNVTGRFVLAGVGNTRTEVLQAKIDEISFGETEIKNVRTMVSNLDELNKAMGLPASFIMGYTILAGYTVSFNFVNNTVIFARNV